MKFDNTEVSNFEGAIRGARNPMNSWDKMDSMKVVTTCANRYHGKNSFGKICYTEEIS